MEQYIKKSAVVAEIERRKHKLLDNIMFERDKEWVVRTAHQLNRIILFLDDLEVKEVGVWKTVDIINPPQADRNKIYCVLSKNKYLLARVINHPQDEDLLQWKCTEFPFHRYDMCEGDKYMVIY